MNNRFLLLFCIILIIITGCNDKQGQNTVKIETQDKDSNILKPPADNHIKEMSLEEKIGQLMIIGFEGKKYNEDIKNKIQKLKPGGLIFFKKNIGSYEETLNLINNIKEENKENSLPLFISVDEEGGRVSRLPKEIKKLPSARKVASIKDEKNIYELGRHLGKTLSSLGFNLNFAPVMDVDSNISNPVIGDRSYSTDKETVFKVGSLIIKGLKDENVIPTIKHFPGHGDTEIDSHKGLPIINKPKEEVYDLEMYPFKKAINQGVDSIMVGHILFTSLDEDKPASLSSVIKNDILRDDLSYEGLIVSDDMTMGAIDINYNVVDASVEFIKTGGDIVLLCHGEELAGEFLAKMRDEVINGNISIEEIDNKVNRILRIKNKYKIEDKKIDMINIEELNRKLDRILK